MRLLILFLLCFFLFLSCTADACGLGRGGFLGRLLPRRHYQPLRTSAPAALPYRPVFYYTPPVMSYPALPAGCAGGVCPAR